MSGLEMKKRGYKDTLLGLRALNNFVKSALIENYVKQDDDVLDLACGKGGDLGKFNHQKIRSWTGVDIVMESLKDAMRRYNSRAQWKFESRYIACNLGEKNIFDHLPTVPEDRTKRSNSNPVIRKFDVVSCQFALHYLFGDKKNFSNFMRTVSAALSGGKHFICTMTDGNRYRELYEEKKVLKISNGMYTIEFPSEPDWDKLFGNRVTFNLPGAIWNSEEYIVNSEEFKKICEEYFLKCVEEYNFRDFIQKRQHKNLEKTFIKRKKIENNEWETSSLYRVFVFRKIGMSERSEKKSVLGHRKCEEDEIINLL